MARTTMRQVYRSAQVLVADRQVFLVLSIGGMIGIWSVLLGSLPVEIPTSGVASWWTILCGVTMANVCLWRLSAAAVARRKDALEPAIYDLQRWQLLLSAVYVLGCGFRSVVPRADVQRFGLYDSWVASVFVGRSVATVAELCFAVQWALLLRQFARDANVRLAVVVSYILVPLIVVAEVCSWYAVLSTCYLGNALEESMWALCAGLMTIGLLALWPRCSRGARPFLAVALALSIAYFAYMCAVDVPMYFTRWQADEVSGRAYLSIAQGMHDAWARRSVTFAWEAWRGEVAWMTLYFSLGVWCSIALAHAPRLRSPRQDREAPARGAYLPR